MTSDVEITKKDEKLVKKYDDIDIKVDFILRKQFDLSVDIMNKQAEIKKLNVELDNIVKELTDGSAVCEKKPV